MYSIKTIEQRLNIDHTKAAQIRGLLDGTIDPLTFQTVSNWVNQCYNLPSKNELIHAAINEILGGYGIEAIRDNKWSHYHQDIGLTYVNMGDTYTMTVCYDTRSDKWILSSWGDIIERNEKRFNM